MRQRTRAGVAVGAGVAAAYLAYRRSRPMRGRGRSRARKPGGDAQRRPTILILGAGFAGVYAARELARRLHAEEARIVLVDRGNFLLFTPMLTEVVGGELDVHDVVSPVRRLSPRVAFVQARVDAIDLPARRVDLTLGAPIEGVPPATATLHADHLVLALGSQTDYRGIPGAREHSLTVKSAVDAATIHDRAVALLERADAEPDRERRRALLTFVVGGGGFSGVETMAALNDLVRSTARLYPRVAPDDVRMVLAHHGERLLPELEERLARFAQRELEARGVEVLLHSGVQGAGSGYVDLADRGRVCTHTLIWAGGVTPAHVVAHLACRHADHGAVAVDECLHVPDHPGVWALGDCAEVPHAGGDGPFAPTAQNATREGTLVARNIVATLRGETPRPFVYRPIGELAIVGRRAGVASVYGVQVSGLLA